MAITDDLINKASKAIELATQDIANQDKLLMGPGDVDIERADGTKMSGPSWPKLVKGFNDANLPAFTVLAQQVRDDKTTVDTNTAAVALNTSSAANSAATATTQADIATAKAAVATTGAATATSQATTATTQADRAKTEADRAQTANPDNQLKKAQNLADVADKTAARRNLDVDMIKTDSNQVNISSPDGTKVFQVRDDGWWAVSSWNGTGYENAPLPISSGGTAATDTASARNNLELGEGSKVGFAGVTLTVNGDATPQAGGALTHTLKGLNGVVRATTNQYVEKLSDNLNYHTIAVTSQAGATNYYNFGESGIFIGAKGVRLTRSVDNTSQYLGGNKANGDLDWYVGKGAAGEQVGLFQNAPGAAAYMIDGTNARVIGNLLPASPIASSFASSHSSATLKVYTQDAAQNFTSFAPIIMGQGKTTVSGYNGTMSLGLIFTGGADWPDVAIGVSTSDDNSKGIAYRFAKGSQDISVGAFDGNPANSFIFSKNPTSDATLKRDIQKVSGQQSLDNIERMEPATYVFKSDKRGRVRRGFIAQEMEKIDPEYVKRIESVNMETQETATTLSLDTNVLLLDALAAIKVLSAQVKRLEKDVKRERQLKAEQGAAQPDA